MVVNATKHRLSLSVVRKGALVVLAVSLFMGCATPQQDPYMYSGAGLGGLFGAGLGAAINHGNPWRGAAIGGLLGAAGGGVAGEMYGRSNPPPGQSYCPPPSSYPPPGYQPQPPPQPGYGYSPPPNSGYY